MSRSSPATVATFAAVGALVLGAAGCGSSSSSSSSPGAGAAKPVNPNAPEARTPGDIPDNQAYVSYTPPGARFSVKVPEGWARTAVAGATVFTDKFNSIRIESAARPAPLTLREAQRTEVAKLARSEPAFTPGTVSAVTRPAGKAIRITYLRNSPPDPVTGKRVRAAVERYVFFHGGRAVVLTLTGAKGADNVDPWRIVTSSLRFTP